MPTAPSPPASTPPASRRHRPPWRRSGLAGDFVLRQQGPGTRASRLSPRSAVHDGASVVTAASARFGSFVRDNDTVDERDDGLAPSGSRPPRGTSIPDQLVVPLGDHVPVDRSGENHRPRRVAFRRQGGYRRSAPIFLSRAGSQAGGRSAGDCHRNSSWGWRWCVVVKIGASSITSASDVIDRSAVTRLCAEVAEVRQQGHYVVVVSSGAVEAGLLTLRIDRPADRPTLQAVAAVGQSRLMRLYDEVMGHYGVVGCQRKRRHHR